MVSSLKNLLWNSKLQWWIIIYNLHAYLWLGNMTFTLLDPPKLFTRIWVAFTIQLPIFAAFVVVVQALWGPSRSKLSKLLK